MRILNVSLEVAFCAVFLIGCGENQGQEQTQQPPVVVIQTVTETALQHSEDYVGRVSAIEDVSLVAQVTGYLKSRHFTEGQMVTQGELLYVIDSAPFEAQVASAKAALAQAKATLKKANLDFNRGEELLPKGNISKSEFDSLTANKLGAQAQVEAAEAQLESAEVSLSHTKITAPFDGRISESFVSIGALVSPSSGVLTTLVSLDPIFASFSVSEKERLELGLHKVSGDGSGAAELVDVQIVLEDGEVYPEIGTLNYIGNRVELNTGTVAMRAVIANPQQILLPGQHIKVSLREKRVSTVLTVPRRAVQTDLEGDFVMLLKEGNMVERQNVVLGKQSETGIIIREGIALGDKVITKGLQRARNGSEVKVNEPSGATADQKNEG